MKRVSLPNFDSELSRVNMKLVVRVQTDYYTSGNSLIQKKTIRVLKRKSELSLSDMFVSDTETDILSIVNFNDVLDGIYEVITINPSYDRESGIVDDWELKLIPYEKE